MVSVRVGKRNVGHTRELPSRGQVLEKFQKYAPITSAQMLINQTRLDSWGYFFIDAYSRFGFVGQVVSSTGIGD